MERRKDPRVEADGVPVELDTATEAGVLGVAHDISRHGLLLLSAAEPAEGDALTLRFRPDGVEELLEVRGKVVRSELNDPESMWRFRSAVELDEPLDIPLGASDDG